MGEFNKEYKVFKDYNIIFDEKTSSFGSVRKVQWVSEGAEPDESKAKIEIRKFFATAQGEKMSSGYAFSTPEGPNELVDGMVENGFGNTKNILKSLVKREDFKSSVETFNDDTDGGDTSGELFDMRFLLSSLEEEGENDNEEEE